MSEKEPDSEEKENRIIRELREIANELPTRTISRPSEVRFPEETVLIKEQLFTVRLMRMIVITAFTIVGPAMLLLSIYLPESVEPSVTVTLLDIFKIWLGAVIGIATNVLQRPEGERRPG